MQAKRIACVPLMLLLLAWSAQSEQCIWPAHGDGSAVIHRTLGLNTSDLDPFKDRAQLEASKKAKQFVDAVPFLFGNREFDLDNPEDQIEDYQNSYIGGLLSLMLVCIVVSVLALLFALLFCVGRVCCNSCGGKYPKESGYTKKQRFVPAIILLVLTLALVACAIVGITANDDFSGSLVGAEGVTGVVDGAFVDMDSWLVQEVIEPITIISTNVDNNVTAVSGILNSTDNLSGGGAAVVDMLNGPNGIADRYDGSSNCANLCDGDALRAMGDQIEAQMVPPLEALVQAVTDIETNLVDSRAEISSSLQDMLTQMDDMRERVADMRESTLDVTVEIKDGDSSRRLAMFVFLALPLVALVFAALGLVCRRGFPYHFMVIFGFLMIFLLWLIFGVHLIISVLLSDSCVYIDDYENRMFDELAEDNEEMASMVESCLVVPPTPVADALGLDSELEFVQIDFDGVEDIDLGTAFEFPLLNTFIGQLNQTVASGSAPSTVVSLRQEMLGVSAAAQDLQRRGVRVQTDINRIQDFVRGLSTAGELLQTIECGFLGDRYRELKKATCDDVFTALATITLSLFLLSILFWPATIVSIPLMKRMPNPERFVDDPLPQHVRVR